MEVIREFESRPHISQIHETVFKQTFGEHIYQYIFQQQLTKHAFSCAVCGFPYGRPVDDLSKYLYAHIFELNNQNVADSKATMLCKECHLIEHFDYFEGKGLIKLVNSSLNQSALLQANRNGDLTKHYESSKIVDLKKTPEELIAELRAGTYNKNDKIKIIFTDKYEFTSF